MGVHEYCFIPPFPAPHGGTLAVAPNRYATHEVTADRYALFYLVTSTPNINPTPKDHRSCRRPSSYTTGFVHTRCVLLRDNRASAMYSRSSTGFSTLFSFQAKSKLNALTIQKSQFSIIHYTMLTTSPQPAAPTAKLLQPGIGPSSLLYSVVFTADHCAGRCTHPAQGDFRCL